MMGLHKKDKVKVSAVSLLVSSGVTVSSLLLLVTANCSFEKPAKEKVAQTDKEQSGSESFVANPFCIACHYGFDEEELAFNHELAGIGCERCHGESQRHRSDENNITPPEIMYPKQKINPTCMMCHPRSELKENLDHNPLLAVTETVFDVAEESGAGDQNKYCTDCHGKEHRINVRTVRWDKATGKLLRPGQ